VLKRELRQRLADAPLPEAANPAATP